nr:AraC family transcriptional regulator [uncultured Dialister sp.]
MKSFALIPGTPAASGMEMKTLYAAKERDMKNTSTLTHWHEEAECLSLLSGSLDFQINERTVTLKPGDTLLLFPGVIHRNGRKARDTVLIRVLVNEDVMTADSEIQSAVIRPFLENRRSDFLYIPSSMEGAGKISSLMADIEKAGREKGPLGRLSVIARLHLLLYHLYLLFPPEEKGAPLPSPSDRAVMKDMAAYIRSHYGEKITLDEIAAAGKVSRSKCCSLFKIYMDSSPIDYVNEYRLSVSRTLLEYQDTAIADIAYACGFSSQSYFTKLFSRTYHMTPRDFRASCRKAG